MHRTPRKPRGLQSGITGAGSVIPCVGRKPREHAQRFSNGAFRTGFWCRVSGVGFRVHGFQSHTQRFQSVARTANQAPRQSAHVRYRGSSLLAFRCCGSSLCHREFGVQEMKESSNKPDAVNPAIALCLKIDDQWRRVADLGRWTLQYYDRESPNSERFCSADSSRGNLQFGCASDAVSTGRLRTCIFTAFRTALFSCFSGGVVYRVHHPQHRCGCYDSRHRRRTLVRFYWISHRRALRQAHSLWIKMRGKANRVAGRVDLPAPTPPDMRVRIRRFRSD
jgi:hypothetical protein